MSKGAWYEEDGNLMRRLRSTVAPCEKFECARAQECCSELKACAEFVNFVRDGRKRKPPGEPTAQMYTAAFDSFTVAEFCQHYSVPRAVFWDTLKNGDGPAVIRCAATVFVSHDEAEKWDRRNRNTMDPCGGETSADEVVALGILGRDDLSVAVFEMGQSV